MRAVSIYLRLVGWRLRVVVRILILSSAGALTPSLLPSHPPILSLHTAFSYFTVLTFFHSSSLVIA